MAQEGWRLPSAGLALAIALALLPLAAHAQTGPIEVALGHAQAVTLEADAATAMIAAPDIADVIRERGNVLFLLGYKLGTTNLLVYDAEGHQLADREVVVTPPQATVTVTRGTDATDYQCEPRCFATSETEAAIPAPAAGGAAAPVPGGAPGPAKGPAVPAAGAGANAVAGAAPRAPAAPAGSPGAAAVQ
jgi:hypothetical protein